jgi:erythromycin esterase-like protein
MTIDGGGVRDPSRRVRFHGLDLYSLHTSIAEVLRYLDEVDPDAAGIARARYGCLTPWSRDPAMYGRMALTNRYRSCEEHVAQMLSDVLSRRMDYAAHDGERYIDAAQNARLVQNAERYYRAMYYGAAESWNLRDRHMFETLEMLLEAHGPEARAVVWEHNSHVGNAAATDMGRRGEINVGELCRKRFGARAYLVGFGTDHGTVAAADNWDEPAQIMRVRPAHRDSYEHLFHESEVPAFFLPLGVGSDRDVKDALMASRLERAIGVIYRPDTELQSHYFEAVLPEQFDEYIWFDETRAVEAMAERAVMGGEETFPFGV